MQNEIWKPVKGYEGFYEVSSLGRVKSLVSDGRILKPDIGRWGHERVTLCKDKKHKRFLIHRLAFEALRCDLECGNVIDHIDGDPSNNNIDNLESVTQRENVGRGRLCEQKEGRSSKYRGVSYRKNRGVWQAHIFVNGKLKHLGHYGTEHEAHAVRAEALQEIES